MGHPLDGASIRIERADKHLRELVAEIEVFRRAEYDSMTVEYDAATKNIVAHRRWHAKIPLEMCLPISDCVHNFRSALDYLIYELARYDSKSIQEGTQFPIEDTEAQFRGQRDRRLKGLTDQHKDAIEAYQPYKGVNWTKSLRTVSNPDKHRHLIVLNGEWTHDVIITAGLPGSFEGRPGKVFQGVGAEGCDVHVEGQYAIDIAFSDGLRVVETLENLKRQVAQTIDAFKPEFK